MFEFEPDDIRTAIKQLKSKKGPGSDKIPDVFLIKDCAPYFISALLYIFLTYVSNIAVFLMF